MNVEDFIFNAENKSTFPLGLVAVCLITEAGGLSLTMSSHDAPLHGETV